MPYPAQEIDLQNVQTLFTEVNTELTEAPVSPELVASDIAWIRTGKMGLVTMFRLQLISNGYMTPAPGEPVGSTNVEFARFSCALKELVTQGYRIPHIDISGDVYDCIEPKVAPLINDAQLSVDQELALTICSNPVTLYDNLAYWQTSALHPYNPNRPRLGKFANKFTGVAVSRAGLTKGLDFFTTMKNSQGKIQRKPGKKWLIASTEDQASRMAKFVQEGLIASDAGTASESTTLKDRFAGIKLFPEIGDPAYGGSPKNWMVVRVASAEDRPFVVNMAKSPQAYIAGLDPNDWAAAQFRSIIMGWTAHLGCGMLWPQNAVMFVEP